MFLSSIIALIACTSSSSTNDAVSETNLKPYAERLVEIKTQKDSAKTSEEKKTILFNAINKEIPAYWNGTPWDFNGTCRKPKGGYIACGYFVTNTLTDLDFDIKRVWLAQQASSVMIKQLTTNVKVFYSYQKLKAFLLTQKKNDAFIVGLSNHTGYMTKEGNQLYFIHSNYIGDVGVMKEKADESIALTEDTYFMVGSLLQNEELMKKW